MSASDKMRDRIPTGGADQPWLQLLLLLDMSASLS
jgi:hypothetical protein